MPLITDLVQIQRLGEKKREENGRFRVHLKRHVYVERKLEKIAQEIEDRIDCTQCASCCRVPTVGLKERDIEHLARFFRLKPEQFLERYAAADPEGGWMLAKNERGCIFLDGNLCSIYDERPDNCRKFPHIIRGPGTIPTRMWQLIDRAVYCPIVYNSLEAFKDEVGFRRQ